MEIDGTRFLTARLLASDSKTGKSEHTTSPEQAIKTGHPAPEPHQDRLEAHALEQGNFQQLHEQDVRSRIGQSSLEGRICLVLETMGQDSFESYVEKLSALYPTDHSVPWQEFRSMLLANFDPQQHESVTRQQFELLIGAAQSRVHLGGLLRVMYGPQTQIM